jgi:hypothetical protein
MGFLLIDRTWAHDAGDADFTLLGGRNDAQVKIHHSTRPEFHFTTR